MALIQFAIDDGKIASKKGKLPLALFTLTPPFARDNP